MRILTNVNINWLRWRWHALAASWIIILSGVALIATRGLPLGIDFSGGTLVTVRFEQAVTEDAVRNALASLPGEKVVQRFGDAPNQIMVRLPQTAEAEQGFALEQRANAIVTRCRRQTSASSKSSASRSSVPSSVRICNGRGYTRRSHRCSRSCVTSPSVSA
jgi:preprotein translocase subunit SecF